MFSLNLILVLVEGGFRVEGIEIELLNGQKS